MAGVLSAIGSVPESKRMMMTDRVCEMTAIREQKKVNQINLLIKAMTLYEQIRYGHSVGIGNDVAMNEVLKQLGLED